MAPRRRWTRRTASSRGKPAAHVLGGMDFGTALGSAAAAAEGRGRRGGVRGRVAAWREAGACEGPAA
eukprot:4058101-Alexandrium_andersonii.AAC.1